MIAAMAVTEGSGHVRALSRVAAVVLTLVAPLIAALAAFVMLLRERSPERRTFLRRWLAVSLGWLLLGGIVVAVIV